MTNEKAPEQIWLSGEGLDSLFTIQPDEGVMYVRADLLTTARKEEREAALKESTESLINEAGKVGQLMDLAAASARREERAAIKSTFEDYFKHFFCTCHGSTRTDGHFASCPITIRDEVLGRLAGLEAAATTEKGRDDAEEGV